MHRLMLVGVAGANIQPAEIARRRAIGRTSGRRLARRRRNGDAPR